MSTVSYFAIYDVEKKTCMLPFPARDFNAAKLITIQSIQSGDSLIELSPGSYHLVYCGDFDSESCSFYPPERSNFVVLSDFIKKKEVSDYVSSFNSVQDQDVSAK